MLQSIFGPRQGFEGGLFLPEYKSWTARVPVSGLRAREPLLIPFAALSNLSTVPVVKPGQHVRKNELLAQAASPHSVPTYAPTSGTIEAFIAVRTAVDGEVPGVRLTPDGDDLAVDRSIQWGEESFMEQIARRGVICTRPREAAHVVIGAAIAAGVDTLIVNGMETEPYLTAELRALVEEPGLLMDTTCEIADAMGAVKVIFALPYRHKHVVRRMRAEAPGRMLEIAALANKYPQCHPHVLIKTLLGIDVPAGSRDLDAGALVLPVTTVRAVGAALQSDQPQTHASITVAGDVVERPGTYRAPIGMTVRELMQRVEIVGRVGCIISGGPLTGVAVNRDDVVITADTTAMLFLSRADRREPVACMHCGWCVEDCPVGLDPTAALRMNQQSHYSSFEVAALNACIDCSLCTHVCPSGLPLAGLIRDSRTSARAAFQVESGPV